MSNLEKLVKSFADTVFQLPDFTCICNITERNHYLLDALSDKNLARVETLIGLGGQITDAVRGSHINGNHDPDILAFAGRLYNHDLRIVLHIIKQIFQNPNQDITDQKKDIFLEFSNLRLFGAVMGYLATGKEKYNMKIPAQNLGQFLSCAFPDENIKFTANASSPADAMLYVVLWQLCKNVPVDCSACNVVYAELDHHIHCSVENDGPGFIGPDNQPMVENFLSNIFKEYTSKSNGGFGLQYVNAIVDQYGGVINVVTRLRDKTIKYSTKTGYSRYSGNVLTTRFEVSIPNQLFYNKKVLSTVQASVS